MIRAGLVGLFLVAGLAHAGELTVGTEELGGSVEVEPPQTKRTSALEFKLGGVKPQIASGLSGDPYKQTFGAGAMLLGEIELDRQLYQKFGSAAVGFSIGYAEKFGRATSAGDDGVTVRADESTGLHMVPIRVLGVYRFDYFAIRNGIPLVPYGKLGPVYTTWWSTKGSSVEFFNGRRGAGGSFGYQFTGGISFLLDILDERFARDFDSDLGVNHSYLFAEYNHANVNNFGGGGLDLSTRHWMFGLTLEY